MPDISLKPLEDLFRAKVINHLIASKLLSSERVLLMETQRLHVHHGESLPPEAKADPEGLAQYILRNPFYVEK